VSEEPVRDTSPRASGPAGSQFEAKVATHYALALLAQTEAFGLPGVAVESLAFQRAGQGHPLDDVIVKGRKGDGSERCLEVQAKRSMAFTEGDTDFAAVVAGIVKGRHNDLERRFAVAIERTSGAIEGGVQETLELARNTPNVSAFLTLLNAPGRSNGAMRRFVAAFKHHLSVNEVSGDEALFQILNRFVVLVFDYARPGSIADHHDRGRARALFTGSDSKDPYDTLFGVMLRSDAIGGQTDRPHLVVQLADHDLRVGAAPMLAKARRRIEEMSHFALSEISMDVAGQQILRVERRQLLAEMVAERRAGEGIVEITGPGGAGKSALLRWMAETWGASCRVLVLAPYRVPSGGWPALRTAFDIDATADVFLADLVCDGGGVVCIDGLDRFRAEGERRTVSDILRSALATRGACVVFTARDGWEEEASTWLPSDLIEKLGSRKTLRVEGLNDEEAGDLASLAPALAALLSADHPARSLARNPFILKRLIRTRLDASKPISEAALANDWWVSGGHGLALSSGQQLARRRVLVNVARSFLAGSTLANVSEDDAEAVASLSDDGVIVEVGATDRVKFKHDLLADWAFGCALAESTETVQFDNPPPFWLSRGFDLSCRMLAEREDATEWSSRVGHLMQAGVQKGWAGLAVLALVRSENAPALLDRHSDALLKDDGAIAAALIRRTIAAHGMPAQQFLSRAFPAGTRIPQGLILPDMDTWLPLVGWCLKRFDTLPSEALGAAIDLFEKWLLLLPLGEKVVSPILLDRFASLLIAHLEDRELPRSYRLGEAIPKIRYPVGRDGVQGARLQLALYAQHVPASASRYLDALSVSPHAEEELQEVLEFTGTFASTAPVSFAAAFQHAANNERAAIKRHGHRDMMDPRFGRLEHPFVMGRAGVAVFFDLLEKDGDAGLTLIRGLVAQIEQGYVDDDAFDLTLVGTKTRVSSPFSYGWSRGQGPSTILSKALLALEHWAHAQVEGGRPISEVVSRIAAGNTISGALLLIIVDVVLSNSNLNGAELADLVTSPETLALDARRAQIDYAERMTGRSLSLGFGESRHQRDRDIEASLPQRTSRNVGLHDALSQMVVLQQDAATADVRARLELGVTRLGEWTSEIVDWTSPQFMASHALQRASRENYQIRTQAGPDDEAKTYWRFKWPEHQERWLETQSADVTAENTSFNRALAIRMAMNNDKDEARVGPADAEAVLAETIDAGPGQAKELHDPKDPWLARMGAAAFLARFADCAAVDARRAQLESLFDAALGPEVKAEHNIRFDVMYDPRALAIAGRLYLTTRTGDLQIEKLLSAIRMFPESAAAAFTCHRNAAIALGESALSACVRVGLQSCIFPRRKNFDESDEVFEQRKLQLGVERSARTTAEISWLEDRAEEPDWPSPPARRARRSSRGVRIPGGSAVPPPRKQVEEGFPDFYFDDRTGLVWLVFVARTNVISAGKVAALIQANRKWLLEANGRPENDEDDRDYERAWTRGIFECAASHARTWPPATRQELVFDLLQGFSDQAFINAASAFLLQSDLLYIEGESDDTAYLAELRVQLWARLKETLRWRQHLWSSSKNSMEINLKELIAAFFFKVSRGFGDTTGYTGGLSEAQLAPFLPVLTDVSIAAGPCPTIALFLLDVLEIVTPAVAAAPLVQAATAWESGARTNFWSDFGIGSRVGRLASQFAFETHEKAAWIKIADAIAAAGVPEGEQLKLNLQNG